MHASKSKSPTVSAQASPIRIPPTNTASSTDRRSYSGIASYNAATCPPVNGGTDHERGSGSGGTGRINGLRSSNGMPAPNRSEHANSMIAFNRWQHRWNTHCPSCSPKYHSETRSGVISVNRQSPNTSFKCPTSVLRFRNDPPRNALPSRLR